MSIIVSPSKNSTGVSTINDLPEETTIEILLKLPVKDLLKSTSVNKTWYSLINNPSFISTQIRNAISSCPDNTLLIIPPITFHQNYCSLISADTSSLIEEFDLPFQTKSRSLRLIAQVNGLLLLTDLHMGHSCRELYLWNPSVRTHKQLVSTCFKKLLDNRDGSFYFVGMGFDELMNDYKIVRIVYVKDDNRKLFGEVAPKVEVFSLRKNVWRKIKNPQVPRLVNENGVYVNGCFYWLELKEPGTEEARTCFGNELLIMSFDFHTELFGEFEVPHDVPHFLGKFGIYKLIQFEDSLALCVIGEPLGDKGNMSFPYSIWLMRQESGEVAWTLRFRAVLKDLGYPLGITKNGTLVIEAFRSNIHDITSIVSYNLKSMIYMEHGFGKDRDPEVSRAYLCPSTVDTSFPDSLIMYEGGKLLLKFAK